MSKTDVKKFKAIIGQSTEPCLQYQIEVNGKHYDVTLVQSSFWVNIAACDGHLNIGCHIDDLAKTLKELP